MNSRLWTMFFFSPNCFFYLFFCFILGIMSYKFNIIISFGPSLYESACSPGCYSELTIHQTSIMLLMLLSSSLLFGFLKLLLSFPSLAGTSLLRDGTVRHQETRAQFRWFLFSRLGGVEGGGISSSTSLCDYFEMKSFVAHAPFDFFFCLLPP